MTSCDATTESIERELERISADLIAADRPIYVIAKRRLPVADSIPWQAWTGAGADLLYRDFLTNYCGRGYAIVIDLEEHDLNILGALAHELAHCLDNFGRENSPSLPASCHEAGASAIPHGVLPPRGGELEDLLLRFASEPREEIEVAAAHDRRFIRAACHLWSRVSATWPGLRPAHLRFSLAYRGHPWSERTFATSLEGELDDHHRPIREILESPEPERFSQCADLSGCKPRGARE